jgi:hypothetical protein
VSIASRRNHVIADPIYLLDFRNGRVVELDPAAEASIEDAIDEPKASESPSSGITFAALGSPIDKHKD